jgi:hypothetical protein
LYSRSLSNFVASDYNYLFHPYVDEHIAHGPSWTRYTFAGWKAYSGLESHSQTNWFTQPVGTPPLSRILYNETASPRSYDLGDRKYLDLDRNEVLGSVTLQPFASIILIDNGEVPLTLSSMVPAMLGVDEAADFTLTAYGAGFTQDSVVRWNGADRPTDLVTNSMLTATIYAADVSTVGDVPVTVYDPSPPPTGTETAPLIFRVVENLSCVYLPAVSR